MSNYLKSGDFIGGSKFLNDVRDNVASGQPDALGVLPGTAYGGGCNSGDYIRLNDTEALALSDTVTGTMYGGIYRRVLFKSGIVGGGNTGFKRGQLVFWDPAIVTAAAADLYQVTNVEATDPYLYAGVVINATDTVGSPLSGFYGWIQTSGIMTVQYRAAVTSAGAFLPLTWAKQGAGADNGTFDTIALATDPTTYTQLVGLVGISIGASANSALGTAKINTFELFRI
jgi:hypothetical protein